MTDEQFEELDIQVTHVAEAVSDMEFCDKEDFVENLTKAVSTATELLCSLENLLSKSKQES